MNRYIHPNAAVRLLGALALVIMSAGALPVEALSTTAAAPHNEKREGTPAFTLNRIRLYVIQARQGEARVVLPPLNGHHSDEVINDAVDNAIKAMDCIRRQYPFADLKLVSQSPYLLQLVHAKGGGYEYRLSPEPDGVAYSAGDFEGILSANTHGGQLAIDVSVLREEEQVLHVSLMLTPGRTLVLGQGLPDGNALFAVLTVDAPNTSPLQAGAADDIYMSWDTPPRLIHSPQPVYPDIAFRAGVEGTVTLHVIVGDDGRVEEVQVAHSSPSDIFSGAAKKAVMEWRYEPARVDGKPVRARCSQTLRFVLSDDSELLF